MALKDMFRKRAGKAAEKAASGAAAKKDVLTTLLSVGNSAVSVLAGVLAVTMILYSGYVLYDNFATEMSAFSSNSDLLKYKPSVLAEAPDDPPLEELVKDYRGWITVDDSPIDYPIVQGEDDLYYASHDVYGNASLTGAIYLAAANSPDFSDSYNLLYGHHMDNGAMFGSLDRHLKAGYFSAHQTATLTAKNGDVYDVTFFAAVTTDAYEKQIYTVGNRALEVRSFLTGSRDHDAGLGTQVAVFDQAVARDADKILALSTCATASTDGRIVVFGRMVKRKEGGPTTPPPTTITPTTTTITPTPTPTPGPTDKGGPTATPAPGTEVTLTVRYEFEDGREAFPTVHLVYTVGGEYYVVSPQMPGYRVEIEIVRGTIWEDMEVIVHYYPIEYTLTIRYLFLDGGKAADTYFALLKVGDSYDVESPAIEGYRALRLKVSGTNPGRDEHYVVIYVPDDEYGDAIDLEGYKTPTFLERTYLQMGICFE